MSRKTVTMATLDKNFSLAVRESYDYICAFPGCQFCGNHSLRYSGGAECAHWHNRWQSAGRWHPDNVACLCHAQHAYLENRRAEEAHFFRSLLGETREEWLMDRMRRTYRYKPWERAEMNDHFIAQRKYIERRRMDGDTGIIELMAWD